MEAGFILDTGGNEGLSNDDGILYSSSNTALKDEDSDNEYREKYRTQQNFRRVGSSIRYHENDKFSKIKPGCLSSELRKALGLSRYDIPLHIYRMRSMGYPPGWLRKAKVEQLPSFDKDGDINDDQEVSYNEDAFIAFPGFNVYSSKLLEKCHEFNCPRIQSADLLENFIASLNKSSKSGDFSRYKQSLEDKDLSDLEGERQRILSEINALKSSLSSFSSVHSGGNEEIVISQGSEDVVPNGTPLDCSLEISIDADPLENLGHEESSAEDRLANLNTDEKNPNPTANISFGLPEEQLDLISVASTTVPTEPVNPPPPSLNGPETQSTRVIGDKPLTADEINDFLAHSDDESSTGSDWDDVREEEVEEEDNRIEHQVSIKINPPSSSHSVPQTTVTDVGIAGLFGEMRSNLKPPTNDDKKILECSDVRQSTFNKFGQEIYDTLTGAASERHEKCVEREVQRVILASEQPITVGGDSLNASQRKALQACEAKRAKALASLSGHCAGASASKSEYFVAVPTTVRVMRPQISSEIWETRTSNRRVFSLLQYVREASGNNATNLQSETTVLVGIIGSKMPPRRSRNNKIFSIWRLTDLTTVGIGSSSGPTVSLFLFGSVHEKLWKEPEGTVIAILKPKILPPNENDKFAGNGTSDLSITVDSAPFVMILGISPDLASCAGTTKAGKPCTRLVNKNACRFCDFHVKSAYFAASHSRPGFATKSISKPELGRGRGSSVGNPASLTKCLGAFSLRPLNMSTSSSRGYCNQNQSSKPSRLSLNMAKLSSSGYTIDSTSSALTVSSRDSPSSSLSKSEAVFISSLVRPSRGSLNFLRALEASSASTTKPLDGARKSSLLPVQTPQPKADETFATFFADAKNRLGASPKPYLGRGLQDTASASETFIDLGPLSTQPKASVSRLFKPINLPLEAARQRAEVLVKAHGGVEGMLKSDQEQTHKRISDAVSKSPAKRFRPSPLDLILGPASTSKENRNLSQQRVSQAAEGDGTLVDQRRKKREELAKLVSQGSRHCDLAVANEDNAEKRLLSRLEARDQIEEKLLNQHEQECQIITCFNCQYRSLYIGKSCRKEGHKLEYSTGVKRFFACRSCNTRTVTLDRYPNFACSKCGESLFKKAGAIAERKGPKLAGEKLLIRGIEEKYLS